MQQPTHPHTHKKKKEVRNGMYDEIKKRGKGTQIETEDTRKSVLKLFAGVFFPFFSSLFHFAMMTIEKNSIESSKKKKDLMSKGGK